MATRQGALALPGLGAVDLSAVRKQLHLLGHDVPDHVIASFLSDMADEAAPAPDAPGDRRATAPPVGTQCGYYGEGEEPLEERGAAHAAHFEDAVYGEHDRYLWAAGGGGRRAADYAGEGGGAYSDASRASIDDDDELPEEVGGLEVDFCHLQVSKAEMRRPMEVKNVWLSNRAGAGEADKPYRPLTPSLGPSGHEQKHKNVSKGDGIQGPGSVRQQHCTPKRPASVSGLAERPSWDDSANRRAHQHASSVMESPQRRPLTPANGGKAGNGSFIVASKAGKKAVKATAPKKVDRVARNRAMADTWKKDKFLNHGGATRAASRPACNFYRHFSEQHAAAAKERQETSREVRANTVKSLRAGTSVPQESRRDHLRFEVRSWMNSY